MSRQAPIYISDSEEEPIEESFDGVPTSVTESPSVHDRAISDDTYVPPLTHPDTTPVTTHPTTRSQYHIGETSSRPIMRRTARICIRDFPTGPLAPRDKAPVTETEEPPQGRLPHLAWVPGLLRHWRGLEGIPHTFETGESSRTLHSTDEPLELTTLTLVAVARTLFGLHYGTLGRIREIHSDISRLDGDVASMYGRLSTVETHVDVDRESADITRARVAVLERRVRIAGFVVGVCVMIAVLRTAVGLFVPRFY